MVQKNHKLTAFLAQAREDGFDRFDANLIIGPWVGRLENFDVACGFSGQGLQ